jgi:hypothetical protein
MEQVIVYIYGMLSSGSGIVGRQGNYPPSSDDNDKIIAPAIVDVGIRPYINPITGQPDMGKAAIIINCIPMPVEWIYKSALASILCFPSVDSQLVSIYEMVMKQPLQQLKINN